MFDEASNIHMAGLLNVFVNILTPELKVRIMMLFWTLVFVIILTCMVPSSSHAKVETLTIALTEVTSATADGILALILKVLRDQNVCAPRLYRFWILKCLAVPCIFYILPHHHNAVLYYLLNIESPLRADFALPLLPFRAQFLVSVVPKLYHPPPPTHTHTLLSNQPRTPAVGSGKNN